MKQIFTTIVIGALVILMLFGLESKAASPSTIPVAKTCGEYIDIIGNADLTKVLKNVEGENLVPFEAVVIKTKGDQYFPASKIESIWGKKIVSTRYNDEVVAARIKAETEQITQEYQKLLEMVPPELRSKAGYVLSPTPTSQPLIDRANLVGYAECTLYFSDITDIVAYAKNSIFLSRAEYRSINNAKSAFSNAREEIQKTSSQTTINKIETSSKVGDVYLFFDATVQPGKTKPSLRYFSVSAVKGTVGAGVLFYNESDRSKADDVLKIILSDTGSASPTEQPSPSKSSPKTTDQAPIIDSVNTSPTSAVLSAGKEFFHDQIGIVTFVDNNLVLVIKGKNLTGAALKTDNIGLDGRPGIEFKDIRVSADGRTVFAQTTIKPTAKEGNTLLTLTNAAGKSTTTRIEILITGTQYLQRKFADNGNVKFFGDWPDYMPYQRVLDLEKQVKKGLQAINKNTYNRLGIMVQIYEMNSWKNFQMAKYCPLPFTTIGCASPSNRVIYVSEFSRPDSDQATDTVILHESAHKLHFYYEGNYAPVPSTANSFNGEWKTVLGNLRLCSYLPLLNDNSWSDKSRKPSRCGFDWSYGAYKTPSKFYEDVATSTETARLNPAKLNQNKASGDSRYAQKASLLDKYGF